MRIGSGTLIAALLLAGTGWMPAAQAQGVPRGSYTRSCSNVTLQGDALVATCRRVDGRDDRSSLAGYRRCVGDIGNNNGALECHTPGGVIRGQVMAGPGPGPGPGAGPGPGPGYGPPPSGWERARWERCHEAYERAEDVRMRLERTYDPVERARLEGRLQEMRERLDRCR